MSQPQQKGYKIEIGCYGSITVEAPTKEECIELFKETIAIQSKAKSPLQDAIR